jgi:ribosome biogenesis protein BRX1
MPAFKRTLATKEGGEISSTSQVGKKVNVQIGGKEAVKEVAVGGVKYTNKTRVLVLGSRGITSRFRHLLEDMKKLIPHHKKDNKLDTKSDIKVVNEIAEMKSCNRVLYMECRKRQDLYIFLGATPNGPSAKFQVTNVHTMDELKLTGNCMMGSRPLLNFDARFDTSPHWQVMKSIFTSTFGTPRGHPKSKPFVDRIMSFFVVKNNIWVRNFQIVQKGEGAASSSSKSSKAGQHLVEIGPRFVLIPIRIFSGSLCGATLYQNQLYVTPNAERSSKKRAAGDKYVNQKEAQERRKEQIESYKLEPDPMKGTGMFFEE